MKQSTSEKFPIAIIAGAGELPRLLLDSLISQGRSVFILAFFGHTDGKLVKGVPHVWLRLGEIGKALKFLQDNQIQEVVMAGKVERPALSDIKPDWVGVKWFSRLIGAKSLGDDTLLKLIINIAEENGLRVIAVDELLTEIRVPSGTLGKIQPDKQALHDIQRGIEVLKALSAADVGQAVVIQEGLVLGVEAIEGTDALIKRAGALQRPVAPGILVKLAKCQQDQRADLPTIGLKTLKNIIDAGLRGIAIEADRSLILNFREIIRFADEKGIFIVGINKSSCDINH